jgi:PAS domain-containing protein
MGNSVHQAFGEAWDMFEPFYTRCAEAGAGATFDDMQLFLVSILQPLFNNVCINFKIQDRGFGPQEETYVSFSLAPVTDDDARILGWFQHVTETTKRKIGERRMATILQYVSVMNRLFLGLLINLRVGERTATAQNLKAFWGELATGLESDIYDISFALCYSVLEEPNLHTDSESGSPDSKGLRTKHLSLEASVGVPHGHLIAPSEVDANNLTGITRYFDAAHGTKEPLVLRIEDGTLTKDLVEGLNSRGFHDPCTSVVVIEIIPTTGHDKVLGFLVLGLNTRRPFDAEYNQFVQVLRRQIATSMAAVLLLEEEIRRGRTIAEQAAIDQQIMEDKLSLRTMELEEKSLQLKHFADCVPVGIFVLEFSPECPNGSYVYRNDKFFELSTTERDEERLTWGSSAVWDRMHEDERNNIQSLWSTFLSDKGDGRTISFSYRVPKDSNLSLNEEENWRWILAYAFSIVDDAGSIKSVIGSLTDITSQKWAENIQKRRMEDALESKRQQEAFIDVTSHEMRNPLSAIMISADDIINSLQSLETVAPHTELQLDEILKNCIDAAQVIAECAQHQKRIVVCGLLSTRLCLFRCSQSQKHCHTCDARQELDVK